MTELSDKQALLLFQVLSRHGACLQSELYPPVDKKDRDALVKTRLISAATAGRSIAITLDDTGWAWAAANLGAALPKNQQTLHVTLLRLGEHLARSGETLADFIGPKPEQPAKPAAPKRKKAAPKAKDARPAILAAYAGLTGGRTGTDVRLAELRTRLTKLDRSAVDAALTAMHLEGGKARLMRIEDGRALTAADRDAALPFKGDVFHVLWLDA